MANDASGNLTPGAEFAVAAVYEAVNELNQATFPSSARRGGRDINKMLRSLLCWSGRGGQFGETLRRCDHPVCAASVASHHFLSGAATPPLRGGEYSSQTTPPDFQTESLAEI